MTLTDYEKKKLEAGKKRGDTRQANELRYTQKQVNNLNDLVISNQKTIEKLSEQRDQAMYQIKRLEQIIIHLAERVA
jgi:uncharacterized protein YlxW (UPF0749 family)